MSEINFLNGASLSESKFVLSDVKKTINHTSVYTLGIILRHIASFIMLPIYTRCLTPSDYGIIELLTMVLNFVGVLVGLRLAEGIIRFYCLAKTDQERKEVISTSIYIAISFNAIGVLFVISLSSVFTKFLLGSDEYQFLLILFSITLLMSSFQQVVLTFVKIKQKPWIFISMSLLLLVSQLSFNIFFVVIKEMHIQGVVYSALLSSSLVAFVQCFYVFPLVGIRFSVDIAKRLLNYSLPLILAGLCAFYITFGDRYFLRVFSDLSQVGVYALGYKFGFLLFAFAWDPFAKIWDTQRYEIYKKPNAIRVYQSTFVFISFFWFSVALGLPFLLKISCL